MTTRPSEAITAAVGTVVGALFIILGALENGWQFALRSTEVHGAVIVIVSWIAATVTSYIAKRQRDGELRSARDGAVTTP